MRDPELREILVLRVNAGTEAVRHFLATRGVTDPEARTLILLTCFDGLVFVRRVRPACDEFALAMPAIDALQPRDLKTLDQKAESSAYGSQSTMSPRRSARAVLRTVSSVDFQSLA